MSSDQPQERDPTPELTPIKGAFAQIPQTENLIIRAPFRQRTDARIDDLPQHHRVIPMLQSID